MASEFGDFQEELSIAVFTLQKFIGEDEGASRFGQIADRIKHCRPDTTHMLPNFVWQLGLAIRINQRKDDIVDEMIIDKNAVTPRLYRLRDGQLPASSKTDQI